MSWQEARPSHDVSFVASSGAWEAFFLEPPLLQDLIGLPNPLPRRLPDSQTWSQLDAHLQDVVRYASVAIYLVKIGDEVLLNMLSESTSATKEALLLS